MTDDITKNFWAQIAVRVVISVLLAFLLVLTGAPLWAIVSLSLIMFSCCDLG